MSERLAAAILQAKEALPKDKYQQYIRGIEAYEHGRLLIDMLYDDTDGQPYITSPSRFFVAGYLDALRESLDV